jgi:hypothetical protein
MEAFMNSNNIETNGSWAGALPVKQGLYDPVNEKDSCGVGFIANIKGEHSHRILKDASNILCNMVCSLPIPLALLFYLVPHFCSFFDYSSLSLFHSIPSHPQLVS